MEETSISVLYINCRVGAATIQENSIANSFNPWWGNLNNNLYFLLLGLGVDDAFVLTSEFLTHSREAKEKVGSPFFIIFRVVWLRNVT